jgi:hypothetical protein
MKGNTFNKSTLIEREHWACPGEWINKIYDVHDLLDADWRQRVRAIEQLTKEHPYPVRFRECGATLIRSTAKLPFGSKKIRTPNSDQIKAIASQLVQMNAERLVHGDVHAKNIWCDGDRVILMDLEPSLLQLMGGRPCLMGTYPRIHTVDRRRNQLSALTDKLGFVMWAFDLDLKNATLLVDSDRDWNDLNNIIYH